MTEPLLKVRDLKVSVQANAVVRGLSFDVAAGELPAIGGAPPAPGALPTGCAFTPRCPAAVEACRENEPRPQEIDRGHLASCNRIGDLPRLGPLRRP
ncbi:oligopeptide/dipeptide ABC transporter ATP-binding protein [Kibdelosporangium aridum]|uniref:oligopeptide/dipeptide ABC transporter ATP-binding protein n=1 Tax=Kibdelosporangium aridum TaxID=2030 RepID=UPI00068D692F|nr:oligopeptide/dipeptide ABC transporter ATP-binding protein [Kibdelosporangium aridum]